MSLMSKLPHVALSILGVYGHYIVGGWGVKEGGGVEGGGGMAQGEKHTEDTQHTEALRIISDNTGRAFMWGKNER